VAPLNASVPHHPLGRDARQPTCQTMVSAAPAPPLPGMSRDEDAGRDCRLRGAHGATEVAKITAATSVGMPRPARGAPPAAQRARQTPAACALSLQIRIEDVDELSSASTTRGPGRLNRVGIDHMDAPFANCIDGAQPGRTLTVSWLCHHFRRISEEDDGRIRTDYRSRRAVGKRGRSLGDVLRLRRRQQRPDECFARPCGVRATPHRRRAGRRSHRDTLLDAFNPLCKAAAFRSPSGHGR